MPYFKIWLDFENRNRTTSMLKQWFCRHISVVAFAVYQRDKNSSALYFLSDSSVVLRISRLSALINVFLSAGYGSRENPYMGAVIGRVANRINRGVFTLDGALHYVKTNEFKNTLHGGTRGWDKVT